MSLLPDSTSERNETDRPVLCATVASECPRSLRNWRRMRLRSPSEMPKGASSADASSCPAGASGACARRDFKVDGLGIGQGSILAPPG